MNKKENRFTIIEVMAVVSIITIMLTILLPSLGKAKSVVRRAECTNTLKQLFLNLSSYSNDNNEYVIQYYNSGSGYSKYWGGKLAELGYSSCGNSFDLSSDYPKLRYTYSCKENSNPNGIYSIFYGYGLSTYIHGGKMAVFPMKYSQIPYCIESSRYYLPIATNTFDSFAFCHAGRGAVLFLDGHADYYSIKNMLPPSWNNWYYALSSW